jgi:hypothetical protein
MMAAHYNNNQEWNINEDGVVREFTEAHLRDDEPVIEELVRQYPEYEHQIRQMIKDIQAVDLLLASLMRIDENNFDVTSSGSVRRLRRLVPWLLFCLMMVIMIALSLVLFKS